MPSKSNLGLLGTVGGGGGGRRRRPRRTAWWWAPILLVVTTLVALNTVGVILRSAPERETTDQTYRRQMMARFNRGDPFRQNSTTRRREQDGGLARTHANDNNHNSVPLNQRDATLSPDANFTAQFPKDQMMARFNRGDHVRDSEQLLYDALVRESHLVSWYTQTHDADTMLALQQAPMAFDGCTWEGPRCLWPAQPVLLERWDGASVVDHDALGVCGSGGHRAPGSIVPDASPVDSRMYVPLDIAQGSYYPHFVDCVMPKLVYALAQRGDGQGVLVYIPPEYKSKDTETLLAQLDVELTHRPMTSSFATVVWACNTPPLTPAQAVRLRAALRGANWDSLHPPPPLPVGTSRLPRLVWLSRNSETVHNGRYLPNEAECLRAMRSWHWDVTEITGEESLAERQAAISNADVLAGEHGGAFYHLVWLPSHASVVELHGTRKYSVIWTLAQSLGYPYYRIQRAPGSDADIDGLGRVLSLARPA